MLEILILIRFSKFLGRRAQEKGRSKSWGALGVLFWFVGEIGGFLLAISMGQDSLAQYGIALVCAAVGAVLAYGIVASLGDLSGREGERPATAMVANASYDPSNPYSPPRL